MTVLLNRDLITNLDEIQQWTPVGEALVDIDWAEGAGGKEVTLCNGFHRLSAVADDLTPKFEQRGVLRLLIAEYKTLEHPTAIETANRDAALVDLAKVNEYIDVHSGFIVQLYDEGEC